MADLGKLWAEHEDKLALFNLTLLHVNRRLGLLAAIIGALGQIMGI